jgi:TolB-like protein
MAATSTAAENTPIATSKARLAVIPFLTISLPPVEKNAGAILADALLAEVDSHAYQLCERPQVRMLLAEKQFQEADLVEDIGKADKFGKLAGIRYLVVGNLRRFGNVYHLTARVVDCHTAKIGQCGRLVCLSLRDMTIAVPELVNLLGLRCGVKPRPITPQWLPTGNELIDAINPTPAFRIRLRTLEDKLNYTEGEVIRFAVSADRDCFVTLLTVDSAGAITLLVPNGWRERAFLQRDGTIQIPAPGDGFSFPIKPPHGITRVKAIATRRPLKLSGATGEQIKEKKLISLARNVRAIGLEGGPEKSAATVAQLCEASEWATAELAVLTHSLARGSADGGSLVTCKPLAPLQAASRGVFDAPPIPTEKTLWAVGEFAVEAGLFSQHPQLAASSRDWGKVLVSQVEHMMARNSTRTVIATRDLNPDEIARLVKQGLRYVCDGKLEKLRLTVSANGDTLGELTVICRLRKAFGGNMLPVQNRRVQAQCRAHQVISGKDLEQLLLAVAERIAEMLADDIPGDLLVTRG